MIQIIASSIGLLFWKNSLHITLYFEEGLCITVKYYLEEIKVTNNILD